MTKGFTCVKNSIILNKDLSSEARCLYMIIKHFSTIKDFEIKKEHIKSVSGIGSFKFERAWKELKNNGILIKTLKRISGKFAYEFTLNDENKETKAPTKAEKKAPKEEVEAVKEVAATKKEETKEEETSIEDELVEETGRDKETVAAAIKEAVKQGARNIKAYAKTVIENTKQVKETFTPTGFSNFKGRNYTDEDYKNLEKALLGW